MKIIKVTSDLMLLKLKKKTVSGHEYNTEYPTASFNCITDDGVPRIIIITQHGRTKRKKRRNIEISFSIMSDNHPFVEQCKWDGFFDDYKKTEEQIFEEAIGIYNNAKDIEIKIQNNFEWNGKLYKPEWYSCYYDRYGYFVYD